MGDAGKDEVFEITDKNYQKITENLEKVNFVIFFVIVRPVDDVTLTFQSGYTEGITDGRDSIFQQSFDSGYEDGFRIGFVLGKAQKEKSSRGNCSICTDQSLLKKPEVEAREVHRKNFEQHTSI